MTDAAVPIAPVPGARLARIRAALRQRRERPGSGDRAYAAYLVLMLGIIVVAPAVRALLLSLTETLPAAGSAAPPVVAALLTASVCALVLAAAHLGPAHAALPWQDLVVDTDLPHKLTLARPIRQWCVAAAVLGGAAGGIVVVARLLRGDPGFASDIGFLHAVGLVCGSAGLAVATSLGMLVAQRGARIRHILVAAGALVAAAQVSGILADAAVSVPSSALVVLATGATNTVSVLATALAIVGVAIAVCACVWAPQLAASLGRDVLRGQALARDAALVAVVSGDPRTGMALLGAPVRWWRSVRYRPSRFVGLSVVRRDLHGLLRAPGRAIMGCVGSAAAGACWAASVSGPAPAVLGAVATLAAVVAATPFCAGLRTAAVAISAPPLLPTPPGILIAWHAVVPALLTTAATGAGALAVSHRPGQTAGAALLLAAVAVLLRAISALKGTIPMGLLAPVPTAVGDMAGINVAVWMLDAPIAAALVGALLAWLWGSGIAVSVALPVTLVSFAALAGWLLARVSAAEKR